VLSGGWTVDGGRALTQKLLEMPNPPTAVFCFNDRMALGAYEAAHAKGLRIPQDISIVGFDDEDLAGYIAPRLSTVVLPHDEMARIAIGYMLDHFETAAEPPRPQKIKVECRYVGRESVAAPRTS
jgi:LacI family transcriptional regulator